MQGEDLRQEIFKIKARFIRAGHTDGEWVLIYKFGIRQGWGYRRIHRMMNKTSPTSHRWIRYWLTLLKTSLFTSHVLASRKNIL